MDSVQKFISENSHQFGYIMQEASRQWVTKDPVGALTVGTCKSFIDSYGDYHTILDKLQAIEEAKVPKKGVYKAIISGRVFVEPEMGTNIDFFTYTDNDTERIDVFHGVDYAVLKQLEHHLHNDIGVLDEEKEHFFLVVVYGKFTSTHTIEGIRYTVDYQVNEINQINDLDKGADF